METLEMGIKQSSRRPKNSNQETLPPSAAVRDEFLMKLREQLCVINQLTCAQLTESLRHGLVAMEAPAQLAARVRLLYNSAAADRAQPVALAETLSAINAGRMQAGGLAPGHPL